MQVRAGMATMREDDSALALQKPRRGGLTPTAEIEDMP